MENNKFGLEEVTTNAVNTVTDSLLDSKDTKGTTLLLVGAGLVVGLAGGWLAKAGWNKFKKRKDVIEVEASVVDKDDTVH
jgi:hypothetical protein